MFEGIGVMNAGGSDKTLLTTDPEDFESVFSPGGSKITFSSKRDGDWDLYIMNADGTGVRQPTNNPARDISPTWQPVSWGGKNALVYASGLFRLDRGYKLSGGGL